MKKRILLLTSCLMLLLCSCSAAQQGASGITDLIHALTDDAGKDDSSKASHDKTGKTDSSANDASSSNSDEDESLASVPDEESFEAADRYYYSQLSEDERIIYRQLYYSFRTLEADVALSTSDYEEASHIMDYLRADCPELYMAMEGQYTTTSLAGKAIRLTVTPTPSMTDEELTAAGTAIDAYVADFMTTLAADMTQWQQALAAYEYVILHADYDEGAPYNQTLYSAVLGSTVCRGYSSMFQYLCQQLDIPCILISGTSSDGDPHAWNMVYLDDEWCCVDCTYGDSVILNTEIDYSWFGMSWPFMQESRTASDSVPIPTADSRINEFYVHKGRDYDSYDPDTIVDLADGRSFLSFHYNNRPAYQEACQGLFEDKDIYELPGNSFTYVTEDETMTIYIRLE